MTCHFFQLILDAIYHRVAHAPFLKLGELGVETDLIPHVEQGPPPIVPGLVRDLRRRHLLHEEPFRRTVVQCEVERARDGVGLREFVDQFAAYDVLCHAVLAQHLCQFLRVVRRAVDAERDARRVLLGELDVRGHVVLGCHFVRRVLLSMVAATAFAPRGRCTLAAGGWAASLWQAATRISSAIQANELNRRMSKMLHGKSRPGDASRE